MNKIYACLDDRAPPFPVVDAAVWCARHLQAPLEFLHVRDRERHPRTSVVDLSGVVGLAAQEALLRTLVERDERQVLSGRQAGCLVLKNARYRALASGLDDVIARFSHRELEHHACDIRDDARLLVIGSCFPHADAHGRRRTEHLRNALCSMKTPALLVPDSPFQEPRCLVLAIDGRSFSHKSLINVLLATPALTRLPVFIATAPTSDAKSGRRLQEAVDLLACAGFDIQTRPGAHGSRPAASGRPAWHVPALLIMGNDNDGCWQQLLSGRATGPSLVPGAMPVLVLPCH